MTITDLGRPRRLTPNAFAALLGIDETDASANWRTSANCASSDPDLHFPDSGDGASAREAKRQCAVCPVIGECLEYALRTSPQYGIWGGRNVRELKAIRDGREAVDADKVRDIRSGKKAIVGAIHPAAVTKLPMLVGEDFFTTPARVLAMRYDVSEREIVRHRTALNAVRARETIGRFDPTFEPTPAA